MFRPDVTMRELARALAVSDEELCQWRDRGELAIPADVDGEASMSFGDAARFLRTNHLVVGHVQALGLNPANVPAVGRSSERDAVLDALIHADVERLTDMVVVWYLRGRSLGSIFDGPIRDGLTELGCLWETDEKGIAVEHRGTETCMRGLWALQPLLPVPDQNAPVCCGSALQGDLHGLGSLMACLILTDAGCRAIDFGANMPASAVADLAVECKARYVWVSAIDRKAPAPALRESLAVLFQRVAEAGARLIVGGGRFHDEPSLIPAGAVYLPTMTALARYARVSFEADGAAKGAWEI